MTSDAFESGYAKLNPAQRAAVDLIDGPVMVVAGPGTGKTQILALRIANILQKTDTPADGVLCLTFTNSGVRAMQERLRTYIGPAASRVAVSTFHSFGMRLLEEFYSYLDFETSPKLIDEMQSVALVDEILHGYEWKHIRTRANPSMYFNDIKSLVSLLKRERIRPQQFWEEIDKEVEGIKNDPENISSRGPTKGNLKAEALKKLEGLERTREIVRFYEIYESHKSNRGLLDYDDVLEKIVKLVEVSEDAAATIRERFLYVLVDEHQDSSGVQNEFLARVWGDEERPNVFVVGDDRQLIYGFGGASLERFEGFTRMFAEASVITLTENYRSTQRILDSASELLQSSLVDARLVGHREGDHKLRLVESDYPRDEIIAAGLEIKKRIEEGADANDCAILVPKNAQAKNAMRVLADLGIPVASGSALKLFELPETQSFLNVLKAVANPAAAHRVAPTLLDPLANVPPLSAHAFLSAADTRKMTLSDVSDSDDEAVSAWGKKLQSWLETSVTLDTYALVQRVGDEYLLQASLDHESLTRRVEIVRTLLHLVLSQSEKLAAGTRLTLADFLSFVDRLEEYGTDVPLAVFSADEGVKVMTLHSSKGLEFEWVWIAHLDEKTLSGKRAAPFTLPESIKARVEERDELVVKRQLYVAITRAKKFCALSYARHGYGGGDQQLAHVIADLPQDMFEKASLSDSESFIRASDVKAYVVAEGNEKESVTKEALAELVSEEFAKRNVSVSSLNNFFECPWKWYFRNLLQLPEPETVSLQFGNVVHGTIEQILKQKAGPSGPELSGMVEAAVAKLRGVSLSDERRIAKDATEVLSNWIENRLPEILGSASYETEYPFYNFHDPEFPHLKITGKIDLMEALDEVHVRVTDFKTGKPKTKSDIEKLDEEDRMSDYLRQLAMYSFLLEGKTGGAREAAESRLEFVEADPGDKNAVYATRISGDHIEKLRQDLRDYDHLLKEGKWLDRLCNFKSYGKAGAECDYCRLAKIYDQ